MGGVGGSAGITGIGLVLDAQGLEPAAALPALGWGFALDPKNQGRGGRWFAPAGAKAHFSTSLDVKVLSGWNSTKEVRVWEAIHHGQRYRGAAWYRLHFRCTGGACGTSGVAVGNLPKQAQVSVWLNGKPLAPSSASPAVFGGSAAHPGAENTVVLCVNGTAGLQGRLWLV